jgi:hypothetical protein
MFKDHNDKKFQKIIDEYILSSSNNESRKYTLRNIDFEAFKLGISFYQMIFILIKKESIYNRNPKYKIYDKN